MTASCGRIGSIVMRMQSDFLEYPELALTLPQAERRFDVDGTTCEAVLAALVDAGVLAKVHGGAYVRHFPRLVRTARAGAYRRRQEPGQPQSQTGPFVGHAA